MICDIYMDEIDALTQSVYSCQMKDKEEVRQFIKDLTKLVYDHKMIGMLYDFYLENVEYHKQNRIRFNGVDQLVHHVIAFTASFPDVKADIENVIVYKQSDDFYKIFRRLRYKGTSLGFSKHGPATGKSLEDKCLNLSLMHLKKVNGEWRITLEVNSDSDRWIKEVQTM